MLAVFPDRSDERRRRTGRAWVLALCLPLVTAAQAAGPAGAVRALADLSLEDLLRVEVVSASRGTDTLGDVAAPVFVITRDDILRTGVRSLPEALRLAPGVDVAQLSGSRWAVGVRGDAGRFSNKLQVLLDGRSLYSPLFSGVFWEAERVPLADIERIEIIRGPAGAMWGSNAVNGVINIITRPARDTAGSTLEAQAGSGGAWALSGRHGRADDATAWRVYGLVDGQGTSRDEAGGSAEDGAHVSALGWRLDHEVDAATRWSLQAQVLHSVTNDRRLRPQVEAPYMVAAPTRQLIDRVSINGAWQQRLDAASEVRASLQGLHEQGQEQSFLEMRATRLDLEGEHRWQPVDSAHRITWGAGVRLYADKAVALGLGGFVPEQRHMAHWRVFAQDRWQAPDLPVSVQTGLRVDRTIYAGARAQPSVALSWKTSSDWLVWSSLARAVREPSRGEEDAHVPVGVVPPSAATGGLPVLLGFGSARATVVESVLARQIGVRGRLGDTLSADLTLFRHDYDPISFIGAQPDNPVPVLGATPYLDASLARVPGRARVSGLELATDWRVLPGVRQQLGWTWLSTRLMPEAAGDTSTLARNPRALLTLRLSWDPSPLWTFDALLRHVAHRGVSGAAGEVLTPARTVLDLSGRWMVARDTTVTLRASQLGAGRHVEMQPDIGYSMPVTVGPSLGLKVEFVH